MGVLALQIDKAGLIRSDENLGLACSWYEELPISVRARITVTGFDDFLSILPYETCQTRNLVGLWALIERW